MLTSLRCSQLALALAFVLAVLHPAGGKCRQSDKIECKTGGQCVYRSLVCNNQQDCSDGSDENSRLCRFWPPISEECRSSDRSIPIYYRRNCRSVYYMCLDSTRASNLDSRVCKIILQPKLDIQQERMNMSSEMVALLNSAVNSTLDYKVPGCPMLYTRVGSDCLSFFSPAKVSWAEARHFCRSIYGDLLHVKDLATYGRLMEFMREEEFTSDYWIGGRYDIDTNAWSWTTDDSAMPLGAPFWAVKHEDSCVSRGPPHTNPYSAPPAALPGAPCYRTVMSPKERSSGWCSAVTYEHFYYWSDEMCDEAFSPLCTFIGPAAHREADAH